MDIYALVGKRVRSERQKSGLTMEQLAEKAGISPSFLAYIETHGRKASLDTIQKLALALHLPLAELFLDMPAARDEAMETATKQFAQLVRDKSPYERSAILEVVRTVSKTIGDKKRRP